MEELRELVGHHLGYSEWMTITQERVDRFADVTGDHQWIHVDPRRAAEGRYGAPVVHGYLILALTSPLLAQVLPLPGVSERINYGCDRVRFLTPVPVGAQLRAGATLRSVEPIRGGVQLSLTVVFAVRGRRAPACVARVLVRAYG